MNVKDGGMGMTFFQCNLLYTVYSIPNCIFPFIGGILIDKVLGKRIGLIIFTFIL